MQQSLSELSFLGQYETYKLLVRGLRAYGYEFKARQRFSYFRLKWMSRVIRMRRENGLLSEA